MLLSFRYFGRKIEGFSPFQGKRVISTWPSLALSHEIHNLSGITILETGDPGKGAQFGMKVPK